MRRRQPNPRLVKIHRSYTVEDIADLFGIHTNTVRQWIKAGLPTLDDRRPMLVLGAELRAFLQARQARKKHSCAPGQMYCLRCRVPRFPWGGMADYRPVSEKVGDLSGICPDCNFTMHRLVSIAKLDEVRGEMDITFPPALRLLREISEPTLNRDLRGGVQP